VGRTFIEPSQAIRDFGVKLKLNPVRHQLEGKRVILVDDSIVRGTTSRKIVRMVRNAGAREVHLRISCPPTISPCFYGVDTPCESELIAANNRSKRSASLSKPIRWPIFRWVPCEKPCPTPKTNTATPATPAIIPPSWCRSKN
jgi:glutamine phosphoribosylpyrophosphate amidotransferase